MCCRIHGLPVVPGVALAAHTLGTLNAHSQGFGRIRQICLIEYAEKHYRRVFLPHIKLRVRRHACGNEEGKCWNSADFTPVVVMDLDECFAVAK